MTPYKSIINIHSKNFSKKSILMIGAGKMAKQYAIALKTMGINDVSIISKSKEKTLKFCQEFDFKPYFGGYEANLSKINKKDLVIITPPIENTSKATQKALETGQDNILIEKPVSLYFEDIERLRKKISKQRVRVAYNRLTYPNHIKLKELVKKDGGITSCKFSLTERVRDLVFPKKEILDIHKRLGIANSIHVISMVSDLIGFPKKISSIQYGKLPWHPSGAIFVGSGISKKNTPFSYHGDWTSAGRWGIEVMTLKNAYRLVSLEELYVCKLHTDNWKKVHFDTSFPNIKQGLAEEIAIMLDRTLEEKIKLIDLRKANEISKFTNKIFGYQ